MWNFELIHFDLAVRTENIERVAQIKQTCPTALMTVESRTNNLCEGYNSRLRKLFNGIPTVPVRDAVSTVRMEIRKYEKMIRRKDHGALKCYVLYLFIFIA